MLSGKARIGPAILMAVIFLLVAVLTITAFLAFGEPILSERGSGFYIWMTVVCAAELVLFAWTANWYFSSQSSKKVSGAVVIIIHVMIVIWVIGTIYTASAMTSRKTIEKFTKGVVDIVEEHLPYGVAGQKTDESDANRFNDPIAFLYMGFTLIFFIGAVFLYTADMAHQEKDYITQTERKNVSVRVPDTEFASSTLKKACAVYPDSAVRIDRLAKRIEGISTSLHYAPPAKPGTREEQGGVSVADINLEINNEVTLLMQSLSRFNNDAAGTDSACAEVDAIVSRLELLVQRRQDRLLS